MNIILATVQVPFIRGGAEAHAEETQARLRARGHNVDTVALPFKCYPEECLLQTMVCARCMDLTEVNGRKVDMLIALKFPAYYTYHSNKVIWLLHQHRQAYDLWRTPFGYIDQWRNGEYVRETIRESDTRYLGEATARYANSRNVSNRLMKYNGLEATPLYHPPPSHERLGCKGWEPYIFYPSRITAMKRQGLLVEAARYLRSDARIVFAGTGDDAEVQALHELARRHGVESRIRFEGFVTQERKFDLLASCSAVYFGAFDEDYGYVTLEAMFSGKPVLALSDSGGALEFVEHGFNGYVVETDPQALAERIDELVSDRAAAASLGQHGLDTMKEKRIDWDYVTETLLKHGHG